MLYFLSDFEQLIQENKMWDLLLMYMQEQWLVAASIVRGGRTEEKNSNGLLEVLSSSLALQLSWQSHGPVVQKHAYGVTRVVDMGSEKVVQLKNPWGQTEWNGKWSDSDPVWNSSAIAVRSLSSSFPSRSA